MIVETVIMLFYMAVVIGVSKLMRCPEPCLENATLSACGVLLALFIPIYGALTGGSLTASLVAESVLIAVGLYSLLKE